MTLDSGQPIVRLADPRAGWGTLFEERPSDHMLFLLYDLRVTSTWSLLLPEVMLPASLLDRAAHSPTCLLTMLKKVLHRALEA